MGRVKRNEGGNGAARALINLIETRQERQTVLRALLGNGSGSVIYSGMPNYVYIRLLAQNSAVAIARNTKAPLINNLAVDVELLTTGARTEYVVLGLSVGNPAASSTYQDIPQHAISHERRLDGRGGWDPVDVYTRMVYPLRARAKVPANLTVYVEAGYYYINDALYYWAGGYSPTFVADGESFDVLSIDGAGVLTITAGPHSMAGTPLVPAPPAANLPINAVRMTASLTAITENELLNDVRPLLAIGSGATLVSSAASRRSWMGL